MAHYSILVIAILATTVTCQVRRGPPPENLPGSICSIRQNGRTRTSLCLPGNLLECEALDELPDYASSAGITEMSVCVPKICENDDGCQRGDITSQCSEGQAEDVERKFEFGLQMFCQNFQNNRNNNPDDFPNRRPTPPPSTNDPGLQFEPYIARQQDGRRRCAINPEVQLIQRSCAIRLSDGSFLDRSRRRCPPYPNGTFPVCNTRGDANCQVTLYPQGGTAQTYDLFLCPMPEPEGRPEDDPTSPPYGDDEEDDFDYYGGDDEDEDDYYGGNDDEDEDEDEFFPGFPFWPPWGRRGGNGNRGNGNRGNGNRGNGNRGNRPRNDEGNDDDDDNDRHRPPPRGNIPGRGRDQGDDQDGNNQKPPRGNGGDGNNQRPPRGNGGDGNNQRPPRGNGGDGNNQRPPRGNRPPFGRGPTRGGFTFNPFG